MVQRGSPNALPGQAVSETWSSFRPSAPDGEITVIGASPWKSIPPSGGECIRRRPQAGSSRREQALGCEPRVGLPGGAPGTRTVRLTRHDSAGRAPAFRRAQSGVARSKLRISPVGVSAVRMAPAPEKPQREQSHHRSLHVVTSGLD